MVLQLSVVPLQLTQATPLRPQVSALAVSQASWSQQPLGQLLGVQAQPPSTQACPDWQAWPVPQVQAPWALQPSPVGSQSLQAMPAGAQFVAEVAAQVAPLQQPLGQAWALHPLHTPEPQVWPLGHALQVPPAGPQVAASVPAWQTSFASQQPAGQDLAVQVHVPDLHS